MRCFFKLLVILLTMVQPIPGQHKKITYGFQAGLVISSFWGNGVDNFEENLSGQVPKFDADLFPAVALGALVRYVIIPEFWSVQGELQYMRVGKKWDLEIDNGEEASFNIYTDYLAMPVLFKILIPLESSVMPSVYAGPAFFLQLRSRVQNIGTVPENVQHEFLNELRESQNISNLVSNFDIAFATGFNLDFKAGSGAIILDFRYSFGAINTFSTHGGEDIRNSVFSVLVGYEFR